MMSTLLQLDLVLQADRQAGMEPALQAQQQRVILDSALNDESSDSLTSN